MIGICIIQSVIHKARYCLLYCEYIRDSCIHAEIRNRVCHGTRKPSSTVIA